MTRSKYRYYIVDLFDGLVRGTNDEQVAREFSASEDFFVIDAQESMWLCSIEGHENMSIEEYKAPAVKPE